MRLRSRMRPALMVTSAVIWCLLWGELSVTKVVTGAILGVGIAVVFPLPPLRGAGQIRPIGLIRLLVGLGWDLAYSSVIVLMLVLRIGYVPRNAIVGTQLRSRSDLYLTLTANLVSLVPGTVVVEARPSTGTIYVHALDSRDAAGVDHARQIVLASEARVIRAFGNPAERAALQSGDPMPDAEVTR